MAQARLWVAAGLVWLTPGRILLGRRSADARHGSSALEFPGGKLEPGEAPRAALGRELAEEWGPAAERLPIGPVAELLHHVYPPPGPEVLLGLFHVDGRSLVDDWSLRIRCLPGAQVVAFDATALPVEEFLAADRPFAERLRLGDVRCPFAFQARE